MKLQVIKALSPLKALKERGFLPQILDSLGMVCRECFSTPICGVRKYLDASGER